LLTLPAVNGNVVAVRGLVVVVVMVVVVVVVVVDGARRQGSRPKPAH
jgi:hypothetical protein